MTPQDIYSMLTAVDSSVPVAYYRFIDAADDPAPAPPFVCWFFQTSDDLFADDSNYQGICPAAVELYTDFKDFALEAKYEAAFAAAGLCWEREETYLDDQRMHMTTWTMDVVLTGSATPTQTQAPDAP